MEKQSNTSGEVPNDSFCLDLKDAVTTLKNTPKLIQHEISPRFELIEVETHKSTVNKRRLPRPEHSHRSPSHSPRKRSPKNKNKQSIAAARKFHSNIVAMVGKVVKIVFEAKKRLRYSKITELTQKQIEILNDKASYIDKGESRRKGRSLKLWDFFQAILESESIKNFQNSLRTLPVIKPTHKFFLFWNIILCLSITFQIFSITIELFFDALWMNDHESAYIKEIDLVFKLIFVLDIFLRLNTGYFQSGEVVICRKRILLGYLKTNFLIDVIGGFCLFSSIQANSNEDSQKYPNCALYYSSLNSYKLLFLLNLLTLNNILNAFRELVYHNQKLEGTLLLFKLTLQILFTAHIFSCLWFFSAVSNENSLEGSVTWVSKIDWKTTPTWYQSYIASLYWSLATMITVGYGDVAANNIQEQIVAMVAMILGGGFFAYSINSIGMIIQKIEEKEKELRETLRIINKFMRRKNVDFDLQVKVRKYLENIWYEEDGGDRTKEDAILNKLSHSLKKEILVQSNYKALTQFPSFFKEFSEDTLERIAQSLKSLNFAPGDFIFQGEETNRVMYFIENGEVEILCNSAKGEFNLKTLSTGEIIGHYELFRNGLRDFSARSTGFSRIYSLSRDDLIAVLKLVLDDWEKFHRISDEFVLYELLHFSEAKCFHCNEINHLSRDCPFMHLILNKNLLLQKYLYNTPQARSKYERAIRKSKNALLSKFYSAESSRWRKRSKKYISLESGLSSQDSMTGTSSESLSSIPLDKFGLKDRRSKDFSCERLDDPSKLTQNVEDNYSEAVLKMKLNKISNQVEIGTHRLSKILLSNEIKDLRSLTCDENAPYCLGSSALLDPFYGTISRSEAEIESGSKKPNSSDKTEKASNLSKTTKIQQIVDEQGDLDSMAHQELVKGTRNTTLFNSSMDSLKSFHFYFPHNNVECIVEYFHSIKHKDFLKKSTCKSQVVSSFENSGLTKGLVEAQNQKRFFSKKNMNNSMRVSRGNRQRKPHLASSKKFSVFSRLTQNEI